MNDAIATYKELFKLAAMSEEVQIVKEAVALPPGMGKWLAGAGALGVGAGAGGYALGGSHAAEKAEKERESTRNLAFAAGLGAGLTGPSLLKGLGKTVGVGATPGSSHWDEEFTSI